MTSLTASSPLANSRLGIPREELTPRINNNCAIVATNCGHTGTEAATQGQLIQGYKNTHSSVGHGSLSTAASHEVDWNIERVVVSWRRDILDKTKQVKGFPSPPGMGRKQIRSNLRSQGHAGFQPKKRRLLQKKWRSVKTRTAFTAS